jgi:hypothetical protein
MSGLRNVTVIAACFFSFLPYSFSSGSNQPQSTKQLTMERILRRIPSTTAGRRFRRIMLRAGVRRPQLNCRVLSSQPVRGRHRGE